MDHIVLFQAFLDYRRIYLHGASAKIIRSSWYGGGHILSHLKINIFIFQMSSNRTEIRNKKCESIAFFFIPFNSYVNEK